jgi:predicted nucleic acid-binding protein
MKYLDTYVFIYAAVDTGTKGELARSLLARIQEGDFEAATSSLSYDEFFWKMNRERGQDAAITCAKALMELPNLKILAVDEKVMLKAMELLGKYNINIRDAIHASAALNNGISEIISEDSDFDTIPGLKRMETA